MGSVSFRNVVKVFNTGTPDEVIAVNNCNLTINDGEFLVFVGPSGCGKSTSLRLIAGLERPTSGRIFIGDRDITMLHPRARNIAMVFQDYALYPHMTVKQNLSFGLQNLRYPKEEVQKRVSDVARILGIEELLDRLPKKLSGGQRQRVALGRAIVRHPEVFLLDEPLSNLDAKLRVQMRVELAKLQRMLGTTTVYVTHDQEEAMTLGHRIVVMSNGVIQQVASPEELYAHPRNAFVAQFIGSPAMNLVPGRIESDNGEIRFVARPGDGPDEAELGISMPDCMQECLGPFVGDEVILGIRPEEIRIAGDDAAADYAKTTVEIITVEMLGPQRLVYFYAGETLTVASLDPRYRVNAGERIDIVWSAGMTCFFDLQTEERLDLQQAGVA
jgi:multiple sugar transport system ATP-binding protein